MKSPRSQGFNRPFQDLKARLGNRVWHLPAESLPVYIETDRPRDAASEDRLFRDAMADVTPLETPNRIAEKSKPASPQAALPPVSDVQESLEKLRQLVARGEGFRVADTPEYMQGTGYNVPDDIARRLHQGDFAIQAHIDLHGLSATTAKHALETFLREAVLSGKQGVLIVHGRGLSSPHKPVLKSKVYSWLTSGPWRKWILAFTSAQGYDGGAGATYVLLRERPLTKRMRKQNPNRKKHNIS